MRACKIHVLIAALFAGQTIAFDAAKLITPDIVLKRWILAAVLLVVASVCWQLARLDDKPAKIHKLVWLLILTDIVFASLTVYASRGMASKAVLLFVIPILLAAVLGRKGVIYLAAAMSAAAYAVTCVAYFVLNFNEGYKIELYGEIGLYAALLIVLASLCWTLVRTKH